MKSNSYRQDAVPINAKIREAEGTLGTGSRPLRDAHRSPMSLATAFKELRNKK